MIFFSINPSPPLFFLNFYSTIFPLPAIEAWRYCGGKSFTSIYAWSDDLLRSFCRYHRLCISHIFCVCAFCLFALAIRACDTIVSTGSPSQSSELAIYLVLFLVLTVKGIKKENDSFFFLTELSFDSLMSMCDILMSWSGDLFERESVPRRQFRSICFLR